MYSVMSLASPSVSLRTQAPPEHRHPSTRRQPCESISPKCSVVVGEELREARMELVATYNLTEDSRKFALEQILARSPDNCDRDLLKMPAEAAALLRTADTSNTVDFWSGKQSAHGGDRKSVV